MALRAGAAPSEAEIQLGRMLYYDPRLSKNHDVSCNSCHPLANFGQDGEATSPGHRGQRGGRNSPTVYNAGLATFIQTGCVTCHMGPAVGGSLFQKLGLVKPYATQDVGRMEVTGNESDRFFFKVPSLRNIAETAPYFHDGSVASLSEADNASIRAFLGSLTGRVDTSYTARPELPKSGPDTPQPDPS